MPLRRARVLFPHRLMVSLLFCVATLLLSGAAFAGDQLYRVADLSALERAFVDLAEDVRPHVVAIRCYETPTTNGFTSKIKRPLSQGSGFVLAADGYIATNNHVIEGADAVTVILSNGVSYEATIVQADGRSDLAVLKIDETGLNAVAFSEAKKLRVNQWAFACGNPFGLAFDNEGVPSVTYGVVSAIDRDMTRRLAGNSERQYYGNLVETSATINPGSSGGPLFNIDGKVIGIVTAIETTSGVSEGHGYAIPINHNTLHILGLLQRGEEVRYGFLGVRVRDVDPPLSMRVAASAAPRGARIERVTVKNGPADLAGLRGGDVVTQYGGTDVRDSDHLVRLVQYTPVGTTVDVTYIRRSVKRKTRITLGDRGELLDVAMESEKR